MDTTSLNARLGLAINTMDLAYKELVLKTGLSESVYCTLYMLWSSPVPLTATQLAKYGGQCKQTVSSALHRIRHDGFVCQDSPRSPISLSRDGRIFCDRIFAPALHLELSVLEKMGEEKAETFVSLFSQYVSIFESRMKQPEPAERSHT